MTVHVALVSTGEAATRLRAALQRGGGITVTGTDPSGPADLPTDVLVIDMESLGPPALDVIREVMHHRPVPVLALCGGGNGAPAAGDALRCGAVDAISRRDGLDADGALLRKRVQLVSGVSVIRRNRSTPSTANRSVPGSVLAIAASTGGPAALSAVLSGLGGLTVPVLLVQHLNSAFMAGFVSWLGGSSALPVSQATNGEPTRAGRVYVAPADRHLRLLPDRTLALVEHPVTVHRPSADELFGSVATVAGPAGIGVLLTGMGRDGAAGLLAMRRAGAYTLVQDEASCAVFGMPAAALDVGAADLSGPPDKLAVMVLAAARRRSA